MSAETPHDLASLEGFERLYRAYYGYAWAVLARLGVPPALVDDAHQDVFVTAYRRRDTFERGRPVKPWLVGIARRVAYRYRRSQQRTHRKQSALSHASDRERLAAGSVDARIEAGQFLQVFIDGLDPEQQDVFVLAELEGYSGPEIAERLGINLNTAYTRLRTVRGQLRRALHAVEGRRVEEARIERGLVLVLPRLSEPGWLGGLWGALVQAKVGVLAGVAGAGVVAAVVIGGASDRGASKDREVDRVEDRVEDRVAVARPHVQGNAEPGASVPAGDPPQPASPGAETAAVPMGPVEGRGRPMKPASVPRSSAEVPAASTSDDSRSDAGTTDELAREVEQLTAAREALAAGKPAEALALLEAHARAHPGSSLDEARAALRIACLCALDRRDQAREEAAALLRRHPGSTLARHAVTRCE
jgi:RNA polymerase sigma-70 factor (ECF subfamily)